MSFPSVTILIPTYGRTVRLAEAVFSALNQDYAGDINVLVVNDFARQEIKCTDPRVSVVNMGPGARFNNLAEKRDFTVHAATGDWVVFLDDDDLIMPWHLRHIDPEAAAIFPTMQFSTNDLDEWSLGEVLGGLGILVKKSVALAVGFKSGLNVGEDNAFRNEVQARFNPLIKRSGQASYVWRRFLRGVGHVSHMVNVDASPDMKRFDAAAEERVNKGIEPEGRIELIPCWAEDYLSQAHLAQGVL